MMMLRIYNLKFFAISLFIVASLCGNVVFHHELLEWATSESPVSQPAALPVPLTDLMRTEDLCAQCTVCVSMCVTTWPHTLLGRNRYHLHISLLKILHTENLEANVYLVLSFSFLLSFISDPTQEGPHQWSVESLLKTDTSWKDLNAEVVQGTWRDAEYTGVLLSEPELNNSWFVNADWRNWKFYCFSSPSLWLIFKLDFYLKSQDIAKNICSFNIISFVNTRWQH